MTRIGQGPKWKTSIFHKWNFPGLLSENKIKMRRVLGDYRWVLVVIGTGQSTVEKLRKKNNVKSKMMQDMS